MVSKTTHQVGFRFSKVDLHYREAYDEIFGTSWRKDLKEYFRERAKEERRIVEMYETGRDIAHVVTRGQNGELDTFWIFVDEMQNYEIIDVIDSTIHNMIDSGTHPEWSPTVRPYSDHECNEDYLP